MKEVSLGTMKGLLTRAKSEKYGGIFHVTFVKRTNGEIRRMTCRFQVKKHLAGGEKKFEDRAYNLLTVYEMPDKGYKCINMEQLIVCKMKGTQYVVKENAHLLSERPSSSTVGSKS